MPPSKDEITRLCAELSKKAQKANNIWWRLSGLLGDRNRQVMYILLPAPGAVHSGNNGPDGPYIPVLPDARGVPDTQGVRLDMERWQLHLGDYICTQGDLALIDWIKEISCEPRVEAVLIDDAFVERNSSCGLFLLNYIEYWTGDELSDNFTQDDMSHFRKKLAAILLSSDINKRKGCPLYKYDKEVDAGCSSDVQILDSPTNPKKRKLPCVSEENEVLMEDGDGPITQADLERWFVHDWDKRTPIKIPTDECTNEFLLSGLSTKDMPVTKADLIDVLCDYIMTIQDDTTLE
uniref:Ubiquitin-like protease family profile domain-containing protein n=1 Tax=Zea mays TaxID=4577 RepID=A0A804LXB9_MAIZE